MVNILITDQQGNQKTIENVNKDTFWRKQEPNGTVVIGYELNGMPQVEAGEYSISLIRAN